jgi:hypothetical protein
MQAGTLAARPVTRAVYGARTRTRRLACYLPLAPVLLGVALLALPSLAYPLGPDQAIFATIGRAINNGGFPYIDAWDQKPPGIYLLYALALRLPGPMMMRIRLFDLLWTLATIAVLYEVGRVLWNTRAATFAALLYGAVYYTTQGWWYLAQPDGLMGLPLLLALLLCLHAQGGRAWAAWLVAGVLIGLAFQLRFIAAPIVPIYVAWEVWRRRLGWGRLLRAALWIGGGFVAFQAALVVYLAAGHAVHAFLDATAFASGYTKLGWPFAPEHPTVTEFFAHVRGALLFYALAHIGLMLPALGAIYAAFVIRPDDRTRGVALMAVAGYLGILAQQKFFWYHWQLLLPLLALLAGWAWDGMFGAIERRWPSPKRQWGAKAALVAGIALATPNVTDYGYAQWDDFLHRDDSVMARVRYDNQFGGYSEGTFSYLADVQVADYLRERTSAGDTIYVFGYDPLIYLLSERESASRFIYSLPLMSHWAPERWTNEFLGEIDRNRPRYFLVQRNEGAARWITGQSEDTAAWAWKIRGVAGRLERDYEPEIEIEDFMLYRRR